MRIMNSKINFSNRYVLALSFGNYLKGDGGTDKVIAEHQRLFNNAGISYIQIAPVGKKADKKRRPFYTMVVDGQYSNLLEEASLSCFLDGLRLKGHSLCGIFIHHLLKFKLDFIEKICDSTDAPIFFMLHDYYSICKQYKLINSNGVYCGTGSPTKHKCKACRYFEENRDHTKIISIFYDKYRDRITIISPSKAALNIWNESYGDLGLSYKVIPHQKLESKYKKEESQNSIINIAFIGKLVYPKGSELWEEIITSIIPNNNQYKAYYMGVSENNSNSVEKVNVFVTPNEPDAMVNALRKHNIDVVLLWSIWPETYSYTYYEAFAADCFVLTSVYSGNIAGMVSENGNGKVFGSEHDVLRYLSRTCNLLTDLRSAKIAGPKRLLANDEIITLTDGCNHSLSMNYKTSIISRVQAAVMNKLYMYKYMRNLK